MFLLLLVAPLAGIEERGHEKNPRGGEGSGGSYCGLHAVYGALRFIGDDIHFEKLLNPRYIHSLDGSTLDELQLALGDRGVASLALTDLSTTAIGRLHCPVIMHVRASPASINYDHWVLSCLDSAGRVNVVDPPQPMAAVAAKELAARWDHVAILVAPSSSDLAELRSEANGEFIIIICLAGGGVFVCRALVSQKASPGNASRSAGRRITVGCFLSLGIASTTSVVHGILSASSVLERRDAVRDLQRAHGADFIPVVSLREVVDRIGAKSSLIVDARAPDEFASGHLPGAVNLPATAGIDILRAASKDWSRDQSIVVYCASNRCDLAKLLANKLLSEGFSKLLLFRGGWLEWVTSKGNART